MPASIDSLVQALRGVRDVKAHYRAIDSFIAGGEIGLAVELARTVEERPNIGAAPWALEAIFDRVMRALALCRSSEAASAALHLALSSRTQSTQRPRLPTPVSRELASLLAIGQSTETLLDLVERLERESRFEEVFACWTQELVVRGKDFSSEPTISRLWTRLQASHHPLAVLPRHLLRLETELDRRLPRVHLDGRSTAHYRPQRVHTGGHPLAEQVTVTELQAEPDIASAVANWEEESNGRSEARRFRFERAIGPHAMSATVLKGLPLRCLEGAALERITVTAVAAESALGMLFSASSNGGAYNHGRKAAYGRLELWQSVAAITGAQHISEALPAERAEAWCWYSFEAHGSWFAQVAWDLGLAAVSPDGTEIVVLAATDTD